MNLTRVILFTSRIDALTAFYRDILGMTIRKGSAAEGWVEFDGLALHRGQSRPGAAKLAFGSKDVKQMREDLVQRGVRMGKLKDFGELVICDGKDPDGNLFQISNRA